MTLKIDAKFEEKLISSFKIDKNSVNFDLTLETLEISTLIGSFCAKYITFDLKTSRGVIFHNTEQCAKFEDKHTCGFENDMKNMSSFH